MPWVTGNKYLTDNEIKNNGKYMITQMEKHGWSKNAICALLANTSHESGNNPHIYEGLIVSNSNGYGLVQWTPNSKMKTLATKEGLKFNSGDDQCKIIDLDMNGKGCNDYIPTSSYPLTAKQFMSSNADLEYLIKAFLYNYERAGISALEQRLKWGKWFYDNYSGSGSGDGYQLAVSPMHVINVSQGENSNDFSHKGSMATDMVGTTERYKYYAPFDCHCVYVEDDNMGTVVWESDKEVKCADGTVSFVSFVVGHNWQWKTFKVGDVRRKGEHLGTTGSYGKSSGDHLHIEVSKKKFTGSAWYFNGYTNSYPNPAHIYDVFSVCNNVNGDKYKIINGGGYAWKCVLDWVDGDGGNGNGEDEEKKKEKDLMFLFLSDALSGWKN